ncbi:hypothetical protein C4K38_3157 [Pseudomonas chlororaphis subsp. piscium]|uniref:hypothetical protein n=1 Tax=Pseudomonas chlororaphis TaxID=587753 RepID=UPI00087B9D9C|nr:hypothetical protein [Pseudomonas chlororaphis]AZC31117.1 hypothetical protein C4K38_3157 [Pseudomonas chlororaphis subsp. piscium]WDG88921.1 hypothetical protein PUP49_16575 [Pseudomonas chlororaphis]SDT00365.1 hypothetical protein SAMN05216585_4222 [Pseudomonas chlororaphis]
MSKTTAQGPATESVERMGMMQALADARLSVEAKAMVAQGFYIGVAQEVSTVIPLKDGTDPDLGLLRQLVSAGWGEELGRYLEVLDVRGSSAAEALRKAQLAVRSGTALFAAGSLATGTGWHCLLSIHHGLADEHSLEVLARLLQSAQSADLDSALAQMRRGRGFYEDYVQAQVLHAQDDGGLRTAVAQPMAPVRLLQTGRLAFNAQGPRMSLQRTLDIATINVDKPPMATLLACLQRADVIAEGDTLCSSHNWRPAHQQDAIGMMTGLVPLSFAGPGTQPLPGQTSLEARARRCPAARQALACCRASELFINGAGRRGIPASQVMSATFPVGIEIRRTGASQLLLEIEGPFCNASAATNLLNELADVLMDRSEWND